MAINRQDLEFAKYMLDQAIYVGTAMNMQDTMMIRAFIGALEEHEDRPSENVKSREWRAMVYRKLLNDPEALMQFTQVAMEKFTPEQISMMLHPQVQEAVIRRYRSQYSTGEETNLEEAISEMGSRDLYELLSNEGQLTDFIDYFIENDPDYVRRQLNIDEEIDEMREALYSEGHEQGYSEGFDTGHSEGFNQGLETELPD